MGRQEEVITVIQSMTKEAARMSFSIVKSGVLGWLVGFLGGFKLLLGHRRF